MKYIADSSLFILKKRLEGSVITVPSVVDELLDENARTMMELMDVRVEVPLEPFISEVRTKAGITKDSEELSGTDIDILAKALEYTESGDKTVLVTDDFAVQNTAIHLGIEVIPVGQRKIKDVLIWEKLCTGCKRKFPEGNVCPVCGSPMKKKRSRRIKTD